MITDTTHRALIAITNLKTAGRIDDTTRALVDRIEELERELDDQDVVVARLQRIADVAYRAADVSSRIGPDPSLSRIQSGLDALYAVEEVIDRINEEKREASRGD